jgi:predicted short-subunit dehydrogenase-like oxidoreductase (DUF2520 family)
MVIILRYAARVTTERRKKKTRGLSEKPAIAVVGAGNLAGFLAPALTDAGYRITEIILRDQVWGQARNRVGSNRSGRALARQVGARISTTSSASLDADILWLAVPDGEIRHAAEALAGHMSSSRRGSSGVRFAFHSSGALGSGELEAFVKLGVFVASVHPLMTFVAGERPSLSGVPFAVEGDRAAVETARAVVKDLGGESFVIRQRRKAAYHAWATMTSPLLVAYLVTLEMAARAAGLSREEARRMSLPILRQTIENCASLGPANSFSGPFIRGDTATVTKHLALLQRNPKTHAVYLALARVALEKLPVKNRRKLLSFIGA